MIEKGNKNPYQNMHGHEFRFIRERAGFSRQNLANQAAKILNKNIHQSTIAKWELKNLVKGVQIEILYSIMPREYFMQLREEYYDLFHEKYEKINK